MNYQKSKYFHINGIYFSAPITAKRGGLLSFGRLVRDQQTMWIEINENMLLDLRKHDIIPPMAQNLCVADPRTINKFNDTINTNFVKYDI